MHMPYGSPELQKKWQPVLDHPDLPNITESYRRRCVAQILENQEKDSIEQGRIAPGSQVRLLGEAAPTNNMGGGNVSTFDPVLISMVRRSMPNLMAYDVCGVQPMTAPTGLIFAIYSRYSSQTGAEALFNEANTSFSAGGAGNTQSFRAIDATTNKAQVGSDPTTAAFANNYTVETGMSRAYAETLGSTDADQFQEMAFNIDQVTVTAVSRALKSEYSIELAQDLKAIHGMDAEQILADMLSAEILAEINREMVRTINYTATIGAQDNTATAGTFDLDVDSNGRWMVERFKGMHFQIQREAHQIAKATRRGKGNILICGSDVASALEAAGVLDYTPALATDLEVDDTGNTFAGTIGGRMKVFVDPYFSSSTGDQYFTVGYKGTNPFDAGLFYCPYVPLQMVRAVGENTFQPKIAFKTRYGVVANPFATSAGNGTIGFNNKNLYYRRVTVSNLM